ncbi:MAG: tyrosine-type recombinase/integrase [Chitinophagaceae bacterium]|nr:tyrosine-type recombinase/integrase [Chitinophagaceae bacterium]
MNIQNAAKQFYDYSIFIKGFAKATIKRYKLVIDFYCKITGVTEVEHATQASVRELLYYGRSQRNWSSNTAIVFHKSLMVFFRWCIQQGYLVENPVAGIEKPHLEQKLPQKLTRQNALRMLEIIYNYSWKNRFLRERNHAMFATFIFAGLRKSELLNLRYADVDIENLTIFIRQGKGSKDRIVPMSMTLAEILKRYLEERKKLIITCAEFFTSSTRNQGLTDDGLKHIVDHIKAVSGIAFSVHKLRHTFATLMLEGGCDIYALSKMMGHSDIKTTTIYLAATTEHLKAQIMKHPLNSVS